MRIIIIKIRPYFNNLKIMYVCICHSITEKDIKRAKKNGAISLNDLKMMTGCATGCGSCEDFAIEILEKNHSNRISDFLKIYPNKETTPLTN